jgi:D-lyxose ketol-isomerase
MKSEDIITRAGKLWFVLYNSKRKDGKPSQDDMDKETPVEVYCDGILKTYKPGERFEVGPGGSVSLRPYIYHSFGADANSVAGEVSSVNDDKTDNYWSEEISRFTGIEEDEPALCPLCNEYDKWL